MIAKAQAREDQLPGDQADDDTGKEQNDATIACAEHGDTSIPFGRQSVRRGRMSYGALGSGRKNPQVRRVQLDEEINLLSLVFTLSFNGYRDELCQGRRIPRR